MSFPIAVALLAAVTSVVALLPGVVLVLRRQSMLTDAIAHAVLPGIVIAAMIIGAVKSPLLIVGATVAGVIVVAGTQWLRDTGLVAGDSAIGLVFPPLFAVGVILLTANFRSSHLSEHSVLVGDLNLAAFDRLIIGGYDFGPSYMWTLVIVGLVTGGVMAVLRRPLSAITFDPAFAKVTGVKVAAVNQVVMLLVSLTVVASFHVAGSILVVALMIVPPTTGLLVTKTVRGVLAVSLLVGLAGSQLGFWFAFVIDAPTSAMMALVDGALFVAVYAVVRLAGRRRGRRGAAEADAAAGAGPDAGTAAAAGAGSPAVA
ncbi:metal ABC transporter permease [Corynebacterium sp. 335C]